MSGDASPCNALTFQSLIFPLGHWQARDGRARPELGPFALHRHFRLGLPLLC